VGALAIPLIKLGGVFDETRHAIKGVSDETVPLLSEVTTTVVTTNAQLTRVDAITSNVASATGNISALTALLAATLGGPVVKVAAFTYGVRSALSGTSGKRTERRVRDQTRAESAGARAAARKGRRG
jgi:2C-methyl-D-erythritol 2,4-cyclodiphosphate synthase